MTTQVSEDFRSEYPFLDFGVWRVFGVIRGEPSEENYGWGDRERPVYAAVPGPAETMTTGNWKGFVERWLLSEAGRLILVGFEYDDFEREDRIRDVHETLEGDFYLVLKSEFEGPRLYIPFRDGVLVTDRARWKHEDYVGPSPIAAELRAGPHPQFPRPARLWYE